MSKSLGDYIVDRTESLSDDLIEELFVDRNDNKISRLLDREQYLIEGSRGSGKTMLMKSAVIQAKKNFERDSVLAVWISFEQSYEIERIKILDSFADPFLQWTMGKILVEVIRELKSLKPSYLDKFTSSLLNIFGKGDGNELFHNFDFHFNILEEYVNAIEKGDIKDNSQIDDKAPSMNLLNLLGNPLKFRDYLISLISDFNLSRLVLLFDEAAHVFNYDQQEKFFSFFKLLRNEKISCKAAVYVGLTNYGKNFERGQDAKEIKLSWSYKEPGDIKYIQEILKKRIQKYDEHYWNKLTQNKDIIELICICSNGNPRFVFHIVDQLENTDVFTNRVLNYANIIKCIRTTINTKWSEFSTLSNRLLKYKDYIVQSQEFIKSTVVPNMIDWNTKLRKINDKLSGGIYIEANVYDKISKLFDILEYSNLISIDKSKKSIGHSKLGYYISLNSSIIFSDTVVKNLSEFKNISIAIENNQAYYDSTHEIKQLLDNLVKEKYRCTKCHFATSDSTFKYCKECGGIVTEYNVESIVSESYYEILRSHSVDSLSISGKLIERIKTRYQTIGEVLDCDVEDLKQIEYIKDIRSTKIRIAAIEYMSG